MTTLRSRREVDNHISDNLNETRNSSPILFSTIPHVTIDDSREFKDYEPTATKLHLLLRLLLSL